MNRHQRQEKKKARRRRRVRRLVLAHEIKEAWSPPLKDAVAARNVANVKERCPKCGARFGAVTPDPDNPNVFHHTMQHESWCPVADDNLREIWKEGAA